MSEPLTLAYLAGIIDADGSIGIKKSTYAMRVTGDSTQPTYSERVMSRQVEAHAIELLHDTFGGYMGISKSSAPRGKPLHSWQVTDLKAYHCLVALAPYLRIKQYQAANAMELRLLKDQSRKERTAFGRGHVGGSIRPIHISEAMEQLYQNAKELNRVGVAA